VHEAERVKKDVESARKENESARKEMAATASAIATSRGGGAGGAMMALPSSAAALPTPRQLQLGTPAATRTPASYASSQLNRSAGHMTTTYAGDITGTGGSRQQQSGPGGGEASVPDYYLRATLVVGDVQAELC
jgi:hypothetical protein